MPNHSMDKANKVKTELRKTGELARLATQIRMAQLMAKHGLDDDALIKKYLIPLLQAEKIQFEEVTKLDSEGKISHELEELRVPDNGIRLKALEMAFNLTGAYHESKVQINKEYGEGGDGSGQPASITVNIIDVSRSDRRTLTTEADRA